MLLKSIKRGLFWFLWIFIILTFIYTLVIFWIKIDSNYKQNVISKFIWKEKIFGILWEQQQMKIWKYKKIYTNNFYYIIATKEKKFCIKQKIEPVGNWLDNINNYNYNICYNHFNYNINMVFRKKYVIFSNFFIIILISLFSLLVIIFSDYKYLLNNNKTFSEILALDWYFDVNEITQISNFIKKGNIEKVIYFFKIKIEQDPYNPTRTKKILELIPYIGNLFKHDKDFALIKWFLYKIKKTYSEIGETDLTLLSYFLMKKIDMEYYCHTKEYIKGIWLLLDLIISRHYTSGIQLIVFILVFTSINTFLLWIIIWTDSFFLNFYQTMAILSNLWGDITFTNTIWYIFGIYLQIIGVIYFWILVNIIWKKIAL